jgi:hypothetical protein
MDNIHQVFEAIHISYQAKRENLIHLQIKILNPQRN